MPAVASAVLWAWIFNTEFGLLNAILRYFGIARIPWLQDPDYALWALIMMSLWGLGGSMIIYLAGLQGIPDVYYEAAEIDGRAVAPVLEHHPAAAFARDLLQPDHEHHRHVQVLLPASITNGGLQNATLFYVLISIATPLST